MRWDPYVLAPNNQFDNFWRDHLSSRERNVLFIIGRGFDFRATNASERILSCGGKGLRECWLIAFDNGLQDSDLRKELTNENIILLNKLFKDDKIKNIPVSLSTSGKQITTSRSVSSAIRQPDVLKCYSDVVIDISAMPRMVAMTTVSHLIRILDNLFENKGAQVNLHVTISENINVDRAAFPSSLSDTVTSVHGFSGHLNSKADEHIPRVWFPILGEDQEERLKKIQEEIRPDEICPVIPFPSRRARRGDEIIEEYRQVLFDSFQASPRNILHACEYNPFEAYRQIFGAIGRYHNALQDLGGCKAFVSPLSSKLLSVGALLACYDLGPQRMNSRTSRSGLHVGMPYIEVETYDDPNQRTDDEIELYSMWIRGEWEE